MRYLPGPVPERDDGDETAPRERLEALTLRGEVVRTLGFPLPRTWIACDLADTRWPDTVEVGEMEFVDCDLSHSRWDDVRAPELRIRATRRGLSRVDGMTMCRSELPGLTMVKLVGSGVDLSGAAVDEASIRHCALPGLRAIRIRGENAHFCTGTSLDGSDWEGALLPGVCFTDASLTGASLRHGVFC